MRILYLFALALAACHPRIYQYADSGRTMGIDDSYTVNWKANAPVVLNIHDSTYPFMPGPPVPPMVLLVTRNGTMDSQALRAPDTLVLNLPKQGSVSIRKLPDGDSTLRYRYMRLVVHKYNKDSTRDRQVAIYPNQAFDSIGFFAQSSGDSLVAEGVNDPRRWGDKFRILAVGSGMDRDLTVTHAGITAVLHPGETPSFLFRDTQVTGTWSIRAAMTEAEKNDAGSRPHGLKIKIIFKHI